MSVQAVAVFSKLIQIYSTHANLERAEGMKRYMKNQFEFFGIATPLRKDLSRKAIQAVGLPEGEELMELCRLCFGHDCRESQYFVQDVLKPLAKKKLSSDWLPLIEDLILTKSWWDSVDFLAPKLAGHILLRYPNLQPLWHERWIASDNIWLQRSAILLQLDYKEQTNSALLFSDILRRKDSKEFFVQKAAGWALRQYARTEPEKVLDFLSQNRNLPSLTVREASKHLRS